MGVVFTGSCLSCLFFIIRHTTLVISAATVENTTPLTHTDSDTTWMEMKQTTYFLIGD